jgi:N4-gp56 family major capsid protein
MADVYTDGGTVYANLLAAGYDRFLEYQLRSTPIFRQVVDKHPVDVTNPGPSVILTIMNEFANLATTPLAENSDVAAVAPPAPSRVTVTLNEYGNADIETLRLKQLAFTAPDPAIANLLGKNMVDSIDKLVQNVVDTGSRIIGKNATVIKSDANSFAEGSVAAGDNIDSALVRDAVTLLRRRNAHGIDGMGQFVAIIHPDVAVDILSDTGWLNPHQYVDTSNIYNGELGTYLGARFVQSPRCTVVADGASSAKVYRTYLFGQQAVVEATVSEPHIVIGPQVDRLRRFFPIGWLAHMGWSIFRQEALQQVRTTSSISAL